MFQLNKNIFFLFFFFKIFHWIYSLKSEIKFSINNVPSLFRCEQNGPLLYFNHFPTSEEFYQTLKKKNLSCQLIFSSIDQRMIIKLDKLELLCEFINEKIHVNNFIFFSTKCSTDLCRINFPKSAKIIRQYNRENININIHYDNPNKYIFQELINNNNYSVKNNDIRTDQIVFQYEKNNYYNMMCDLESTIGICHRYIWNESIIIKDDWSWICYYYPSKSENPIDYNMIYKAVEEFEEANPEAPRILLRKFDIDSSLSLNGTNIDLSKNVRSVFLFLIISIGLCGIYCYCCKNKSIKTIDRYSQDSEDSQESLEEIFIE